MTTPGNNKLNNGSLFGDIPEILKEELITDLLNREGFSIRRIVSKGHSSPASGWYDQPDNEWVLVVKGEGEIAYEDGSSHQLKAGDYVNILAHIKHKVLWTTPVTETVWLAIHYK